MNRFGTPQGPTDLRVEQPFRIPREEAGAFRSTTLRGEHRQPQPSTAQSVEEKLPNVEATRVYFACPEEGCTKTYQSFANLQKHMDVGKHLVRLERETTYDSIKRKWAETCKEVSGSYIHKETGSSSQTACADPACEVAKGWALKTSRKATRFSEKVKTYPKRTFLEGEETGRKQSAVDVCSKIKTLRDGNGRKMFNKEEWLVADQIARYFSRLSVMYRSGRLAIEEDFVAEAEEISTRLEI